MESMRFQSPRGTEDVLPSQSHLWITIENEFRALTELYGYREIRTPTFEDTDLFVRTSGETSDIVSKQMYTFLDKGDRSITLKPEGTAPAMRSLLEHGLCPPGNVCRLSYVTPIFRYERPQKGRLRESHQVGLELVGSSSPMADAEVIEVTYRFYERIGIEGVVVYLNSLGREECRSRYRSAILEHAAPVLKDQSEEVRAKAEKNPLRLLDTKDPLLLEAMKTAPSVLDFLEEDSKARFEELQSLLTEAGVPFEVQPGIVRGLDYYTETVFEVLSTKLGAQSALCGGGRYDGLIKDLGGPPTPSVGVAMGIERAVMVLEEIGRAVAPDGIDVFVVSATEEAFGPAREIARDLRSNGISATFDLESRKVAGQMKQADKIHAHYAVVIGPDELAKGVVQLRDLRTSSQREVNRAQLAAVIRSGRTA